MLKWPKRTKVVDARTLEITVTRMMSTYWLFIDKALFE